MLAFYYSLCPQSDTSEGNKTAVRYLAGTASTQRRVIINICTEANGVWTLSHILQMPQNKRVYCYITE